MSPHSQIIVMETKEFIVRLIAINVLNNHFFYFLNKYVIEQSVFNLIIIV